MFSYVIRALLCLWTLAALGVGSQSVALPVNVLPNGAVWALGLLTLWALYGHLRKTPLRVWLLAMLFAGVMTLGESFRVLGTAEWVLENKGTALLFFTGRVPMYAAGMQWLLHALQKKAPAARPHASWQWALGLLVCWLPWYVCLFPGTVSNDSISQLMSVLGLAPLTNANPLCQTGLVALFRRLGLLVGSADAGVALYCVVQSVLMAWLLGDLLREMGHAPRWLVYGSFAFYAFCPVFPVFAFCVGKDTNFAMAVLWLTLEVWRAAHKKARVLPLCLSAVACTLLRNPGIYLSLLTLGLLCLWLFKNRGAWPAPVCGMAAAAAVFAALQLLVLPVFDIAPMPETEEYSIPLQQIARVAAGNALTEEQSQALSGVLPVEELKAAYNGELSDPVKDLWKQDATEEAKALFWQTWLDVLKSEPVTCFSATFHNTYGYLYPGYISTIKPTLIVGDQTTRTASVRGLYDFSVNPLSVSIKAFLEKLNENPLYRLVISPGLYGWLALTAIVLLCRKRSTALWLCAVPALFTLMGCLLSAVNGYFRYAMPLYLSAPLLLWLLWQQKEA